MLLPHFILLLIYFRREQFKQVPFNEALIRKVGVMKSKEEEEEGRSGELGREGGGKEADTKESKGQHLYDTWHLMKHFYRHCLIFRFLQGGKFPLESQGN